MSDTPFENFEKCLKYFCQYNIEDFREKHKSEPKQNLVSDIITILEAVIISAKLLLNDLDLMCENESFYVDSVESLLEAYDDILNPISLKIIKNNLLIIKGELDLLSTVVFASKNDIFQIITLTFPF